MAKLTIMKQLQIAFLLLLFAAVACGKKEANVKSGSTITTKEVVETDSAAEPTNLVIVPIKLVSSAFKIDKETDSVITIEPCTPYYQTWISPKRMTLPSCWDENDTFDNPNLNIYLTNNSDQSIVVKSLDLIVSESKIDDLPYLRIDNDETDCCLHILNQSWLNWGKIYLDYSILKKGEKFNGKYKARKTIPYFNEVMYVDFTRDLAKMGLDTVFLSQNDYYLDHDEYTLNQLLKIFHPFEVDEEGYGIFRIYGKISFAKSKFTKEFNGTLYITHPIGNGAADVVSDKFDVKLEYNKRDYTISYPYKTVLNPGDNELVKLKLNCPRSSNHRFYISIKNDNGMVIRTKAVQMHFLNGRFSNLNFHE